MVRFYMALKSVRASLINARSSPAAGALRGADSKSLGLLEESDEPLQEQVLSQKRLATYFGSVQIGQCVDEAGTKTVTCTDEQREKITFKMLFDTGSSEFWIPGIGCTRDPKYSGRCENHHTYNPENSQSYTRRFGGAGPYSEDQKMCIQYLSGKVEGFLGRDYVCVGSLCVSEQVFGMADIIDVPLLDEVVWDGIIGLAFPNEKLNDQGVKPLFDNMIEKQLLSNQLFAYYIGMSEGAVTFGGVDKKYFADPKDNKFRFAVVTDKTYWTIEIVDILLQFGDKNPESTGLCADQRCKAIVDTGTYLIYGPREQVTGPLSSLRIDGCGDVDPKKLPSVIFKMYAGEGQEPARLVLHPHDYVLEFTVPTETNDVFLEEGLSAASKHLEREGTVDCVDEKNRKDPSKCQRDCVIGISPDNDPGWTLGQVFLRSFYTVFDRTEGAERVGFLRNNPRIGAGAPKPLMGSIQGELRKLDNTLLAKNGHMTKLISPPQVKPQPELAPGPDAVDT